MNTYHKTILQNGIRVIIVPMQDNPTVTVQVLVETGSRYENQKENGLSHFLEHMCFKGTTSRPSSQAISHEFDALGAANNAFTGDEVTGYWGKARAHQFDRIIDIVSDLYLNPLLSAPDIEKERGVIIEEINMYEDLPQRVVHDVLDGLLYGDQPAGRTILGPKENIKSFSRDDFVRYRARHYTASKTVIVVAGGVDRKHALVEIKKRFARVPKGVYAKRAKTKEVQRVPQLRAKHKKTDQTHFILGFRSCTLADKKNPVYGMLATVLGQGMSSRLFQKLRDEMGVCYYVRAGNQTSTDTGVFKIVSGVATDRFEEVVGEILREIRKIKDTRVPASELAKAKEFIIGNSLMGLESSDSLADWYGEQEVLRQRIKTPKELLKEIEGVTAAQVQAAAKKIFVNKNLNLAFVGPNKVTPSLKKILAV